MTTSPWCREKVVVYYYYYNRSLKHSLQAQLFFSEYNCILYPKELFVQCYLCARPKDNERLPNRNLKVRHLVDDRVELLFRGRTDILSQLVLKLPPTTHDLHSFVVDVPIAKVCSNICHDATVGC